MPAIIDGVNYERLLSCPTHAAVKALVSAGIRCLMIGGDLFVPERDLPTAKQMMDAEWSKTGHPDRFHKD